MAFLPTFFILYLFWIVMSGRFDLFHLTLGVISCAIVSHISHDWLIKDTGICRGYHHRRLAPLCDWGNTGLGSPPNSGQHPRIAKRYRKDYRRYIGTQYGDIGVG